jgi:hypothetical protein
VRQAIDELAERPCPNWLGGRQEVFNGRPRHVDGVPPPTIRATREASLPAR